MVHTSCNIICFFNIMLSVGANNASSNRTLHTEGRRLKESAYAFSSASSSVRADSRDLGILKPPSNDVCEPIQDVSSAQLAVDQTNYRPHHSDPPAKDFRTQNVLGSFAMPSNGICKTRYPVSGHAGWSSHLETQGATGTVTNRKGIWTNVMIPPSQGTHGRFINVRANSKFTDRCLIYISLEDRHLPCLLYHGSGSLLRGSWLENKVPVVILSSSTDRCRLQTTSMTYLGRCILNCWLRWQKLHPYSTQFISR